MKKAFLAAGLITAAIMVGVAVRALNLTSPEVPGPAEDSVGIAPSPAAIGAAAPAVARRLWLLPPPGDSAPVMRGTSYAELAKRFREANLRASPIYLGEGETTAGTVLFPDDSARRLEIVWVDSTTKSGIARLRVDGSRSEWMVAPEITLGTSLLEIEKMNKGPVTLTGFDWDYGGIITDFRGGRLAHLKQREPVVFLQLRPPANEDPAIERDRAQVRGDAEFRSDMGPMQRLNPRVHLIIVEFKRR